MPSSITLTVSNLAPSASFFQSTLHPLNYKYRGSSGKTIGFGPADSSAPADFWITQEVPGVPAGAAHVSFSATSRTAVHEFFTAALRAGGKIHGEPCLRDSSGYYSAAVIDFDGNSIEAVYRPPIDMAQSQSQHGPAMSVVAKRTSARASTVVSRSPSSASKARSVVVSRTPSAVPSAFPSRQPLPPQGDALDRLLDSARNTADVARNLIEQVRPQVASVNSNTAAALGVQSPQSHESSDAIVGTLLGVAAGAALHYVFSNRNSSPEGAEQQREQRQHQQFGSHSVLAHRPMLGARSSTDPVARYDFAGESDGKSLYSRGGGKYITMEDNDYASTIASGASGASGTSKKSIKMIKGPPSSYKPPTVITQAQTQLTRRSSSRRSSSVSRVSSIHRQSSLVDQKAGSSTSRRRSSSVGRSGTGTGAGAHSVLHMTEIQSSHTTPSRSAVAASSSSHHSQASTVKPIKVIPASVVSKAPSQNPSRAPSKTASQTSRVSRPPPSRAATWADGQGGSRGRTGSEASFATARSGGAKTILGLERLTSEASQTRRSMTASVVGKLKDIKRLELNQSDEVSPDDSVSQISSTRGSRRSSARH